MPSPFPGMDPYLEEPDIWSDCHVSLIVAMRAELNARLPSSYHARADRYVWLYESASGRKKRLGKPDVFVTHARGLETGGAMATLVAPARSVLPAVRRHGNRFLRIVDRRTHRVVTVIELMSASNKDPHDNRPPYLAKRNEYLATGTNLVEIDLLREGKRMPMGKPPPPAADYYVVICRAVDFPATGIWPFSVRDSIPKIRIPLNPGDEAVELPLKKCLDRVYDEGRYGEDIDYLKPSTPPLSKSDAAWARRILADKKAIP